MNKYGRNLKVRTLLMAAILASFAAGCGQDGIFGSDGQAPVAPASSATIIPGAVCTAGAGPTIPTATSSDPTSGNPSATTSTTGVAGGGKLIVVTFDRAMNPATINSPLTTFSLRETAGGANVPGTVSMNASSTVATLTTAAALAPSLGYTASVTVAATSGTGVAMACAYEWSFTTVTPPTAGPAPVNLGLAAPFGIAATAGIQNTPTAPLSTINGNAVLDPLAECNSVAIDAAGGFGLCGGSPPTINGIVISPMFPDAGATSGAIKNDLLAAFLSITPPAGPPAAGSLGGATPIAAGTTLGEPTGAALVQGDNLFAPGVYQSLTSILITGDLTLDGQGDPNAKFIFQSSSTVGTAAGAPSPGIHTRILLINGAKASNVFWQAGSSATLGAFSEFQGNILASASITMITGATSCGRLLAGAFTAGAFVFDSNVVSVPGNASAPPTCQ